jgi:hypothetical protein
MMISDVPKLFVDLGVICRLEMGLESTTGTTITSEKEVEPSSSGKKRSSLPPGITLILPGISLILPGIILILPQGVE